MELVKPTVFLVGQTQAREADIQSYLDFTGTSDFMETFRQALNEGISGGEALCSMFAKLCYKSLTTEGNDNISRVRDIAANIESCFSTGHGSVFEHCSFSFIITNCSRVFTHELVRHRVGSAFSQTSGRYVRSKNLQMVLEDPITEQVSFVAGTPNLLNTMDLLKEMESWAEDIEENYNRIVDCIDWAGMDFATKKKVTSYLRRMLPNGQANEIAVTLNIRSLRHFIQMRTSAHAEWEIRYVFAQIADLISAEFPTVLHGATTSTVDGMTCVEGMKMQPYENLAMFSGKELADELQRRMEPNGQ